MSELNWQQAFKENQLTTLDAFWQLGAQALEAQNVRKHGTAQTAYHQISDAQGRSYGFYLKKQTNFFCQDPLSRLLKRPVAWREQKAMQHYARWGIPATHAVFYAVDKQPNCVRAVLVIPALVGYQSLDTAWQQWQGDASCLAVKQRALVQTAQQLWQVHDKGWVYGCFYPKHIFVQVAAPHHVTIRFIDLEKTKPLCCAKRRMMKDLGALNRRSQAASLIDKMRFFKAYLGVSRLHSKHKRIWRALANASKK